MLTPKRPILIRRTSQLAQLGTLLLSSSRCRHTDCIENHRCGRFHKFRRHIRSSIPRSNSIHRQISWGHLHIGKSHCTASYHFRRLALGDHSDCKNHSTHHSHVYNWYTRRQAHFQSFQPRSKSQLRLSSRHRRSLGQECSLRRYRNHKRLCKGAHQGWPSYSRSVWC